MAFDTILAILNLTGENIPHCSKYISLIFVNYKLQDDEDFLMEEGQTLMHSVAEDGHVGNLISFLMPDWFDPSNAQKYCLVTKFEQYEEEGKKLAKKLYEIIDDENHLMYRDACLRIIYQFLEELLMTEENEDEESVSIIEVLCIDEVFSMRNFEYKQMILEVIVVFWKANCSSDIYKDTKQKIMNIYQNESDEKLVTFFDLAFSLKENLSVKFQNDFETFIDQGKKQFGAYFKIALKHPVRLLAAITEDKDNMLGTREFIYLKFPYIEVNSSIIANFSVVQDFRVVNFFPFKSKSLLSEKIPRHANPEDLTEHFNDLKSMVENYENDRSVKSRDVKRFFFGRDIHCDKSLFELILSTPGTSELLILIWNKFELYSREEILNMRFSCRHDILSEVSQGETLLSLVLESEDDENLTTFLLLSDEIHPTFTKKSTYMKLKSDQLFKLKGKTIFEHHLTISINDLAREKQLCNSSYPSIVSLLEELNEFDIFEKLPESIEKVKILASDRKFYEKLGVNIEDLKSKYDKHREGILDDTSLEIELSKKIYFVDDLLFTLVSYCKEKDLFHPTLKKGLPKPYNLLFSVIEGNEKDFIENFRKELEDLETTLLERYKSPQGVEHYISCFIFYFFWAAVIHNREHIIDHIVDYKNFSTIDLHFPVNVRSTKTCHYAATKLLESGHEIGKGELPSSWISSSDFEKFLDSRVTFENTELIEIDCNFLLHAQTKKYQVKSRDDVDNKLIFWEDTDSLSHILNKENLKSFLTHPVIETYINLKTHKYHRIYFGNLLMFALCFILPFGLLFSRRFLFEHKNQSVNIGFCFVSIFFLFLRELFQLFLVEKNLRNYAKKVSNRLELLLIVSSLVTLIVFIYEGTQASNHGYAFFVATIFLMLTVLIMNVPLEKVSLNMMILKKVLRTFFYFLITFTMILIAFSFSFCMIFKSKMQEEKVNLLVSNTTNTNTTEENTTNTNTTEDHMEDKKDDAPFKNFSTFPTAFSKVLLMLSGEYTIEPFILVDYYQIIFFLFFVVSTFVIFNLIQGLTFDDVQKLREDSSRLILEQNAGKFIEMSDFYFSIYKQFK